MSKKIADLTLKEIETICKNQQLNNKKYACQGCPLEFNLEGDLGYRAKRCIVTDRLYKNVPEDWHLSKYRKEIDV